MGIKEKQPLMGGKTKKVTSKTVIQAQRDRDEKRRLERQEAKRKRSHRAVAASDRVGGKRSSLSAAGAAELAKAVNNPSDGQFAKVGSHVTNGQLRHVVHVTHDGFNRPAYTLSA